VISVMFHSGVQVQGQDDRLWLSSLPLMRSIFGKISLWVESFRGLRVWIVLWDVVWGGAGRGGVEVFVSRILRVY
jgi:hypothetical protein